MRRLIVPIIALSLVLAGCGQHAESTPPAAASPTRSASPSPAAIEPLTLGDYADAHDPQGDIARALAAAKVDGKPVLVDFGAAWCADCAVLRQLAELPTVTPLLNGYHLVTVDVGEFNKNLDVARSLTLNLNKSGIPALVVMTPAGKVREVTNDGSFENARTMTAAQFAGFLNKWK